MPVRRGGERRRRKEGPRLPPAKLHAVRAHASALARLADRVESIEAMARSVQGMRELHEHRAPTMQPLADNPKRMRVSKAVERLRKKSEVAGSFWDWFISNAPGVGFLNKLCTAKGVDINPIQEKGRPFPKKILEAQEERFKAHATKLFEEMVALQHEHGNLNPEREKELARHGGILPENIPRFRDYMKAFEEMFPKEAAEVREKVAEEYEKRKGSSVDLKPGT